MADVICCQLGEALTSLAGSGALWLRYSHSRSLEEGLLVIVLCHQPGRIFPCLDGGGSALWGRALPSNCQRQNSPLHWSTEYIFFHRTGLWSKKKLRITVLQDCFSVSGPSVHKPYKVAICLQGQSRQISHSLIIRGRKYHPEKEHT